MDRTNVLDNHVPIQLKLSIEMNIKGDNDRLPKLYIEIG